MKTERLVKFDGTLDIAAYLFTYMHKLQMPLPDSVHRVTWEGYHAWNGEPRDIRYCLRLEGYGDLLFDSSLWRNATEEEINTEYYAEFEVIESCVNT